MLWKMRKVNQRNVLDNKKTTLRRLKQKDGSQKINFLDNHHPDGRGCINQVLAHLVSFYFYVVYA